MPALRIKRFIVDVLLQRQTIRERPAAGVAHALVFWGFVAFAGYTLVEFSYGLGIVDLTRSAAFQMYRVALVPFAAAVLVGILFLLIRRVVARPAGLGATVSMESVVIALFIATLMVTFLLGFTLDERTLAGRVNWWAHMLVILAFLALIPASKHFHLVLSPITVFLKSPELGRVENLDFEKEQVGLEVVKDLGKKTVLDAFTCVECGRCQVNCPGVGRGQGAESEGADSADAGRAPGRAARQEARRDLQREGAVAVHDLRRLREPVPGGHRARAAHRRRAARAGLERRRAGISGRHVQQPRAPAQHLGPRLRAAAEIHRSRRPRDLRSRQKHEWLVWLGCAGAFEADYQKSLRALFDILRARRPDVRRAGERSAATAIRPSGPETSTCFRSWPTRTSRRSRQAA